MCAVLILVIRTSVCCYNNVSSLIYVQTKHISKLVATGYKIISELIFNAQFSHISQPIKCINNIYVSLMNLILYSSFLIIKCDLSSFLSYQVGFGTEVSISLINLLFRNHGVLKNFLRNILIGLFQDSNQCSS